MTVWNKATPTLVERLCASICSAIKSGQLPPGARLPSIRRQAAELGVSTFTVADAYDRLLTQGHIQSRPGSGFYVLARPAVPAPIGRSLSDLPIDEHWLLHKVYEHAERGIAAGGGWLPAQWYDAEALNRALRSMARDGMARLDYGDPRGLLPLRQLLAQRITEQGMSATAASFILTQGASQALEMVAATIARAGDTLLVDDPAYCNLLSSLTYRGFHLVGVPWTATGPDIGALKQLLTQHRPRAYFTNPRLHNPTGASYSPAVAHQVVALAEQNDFLLIEDDVSADLSPNRALTLAALGGAERVVYIGSFSKSMSPGLRVGYICAAESLCESLVRFKMLSGLTTPELNEQLALAILGQRDYRRQLERLRNRLAEAHYQTERHFDALGWEVFARPGAGVYLFARPQSVADSHPLAEAALKEDILLAPGRLFRPHCAASPWLRFNVAFSQSPRLWDFLARSGDMPCT
ncbi:PLP-dependent aminotransferase family protein [Paludibacterium yongneupense]|uniref:aminotransferase-like domain-containing protein n=1 Tax=Paludibacterium yongneupense TaxID=400061 RepID=UPI000424ED85|nr:PLP-dependent aminotransferase family protein [Paludibacterium yongneupense]